MGATHASTDNHRQSARYEIRLEGNLDARWVARFDGLDCAHERDDTTIIHGPVGDQAALPGLLQNVRDVGPPLVAVMPVGPDQPAVPTSAP